MGAKIDRDQTERALIERKICLERENWNLNREIFVYLLLQISPSGLILQLSPQCTR